MNIISKSQGKLNRCAVANVGVGRTTKKVRQREDEPPDGGTDPMEEGDMDSVAPCCGVQRSFKDTLLGNRQYSAVSNADNGEDDFSFVRWECYHEYCGWSPEH